MSLWILGLALTIFAPHAFGQAAGPGSENPENQPGQPIKPGPAPAAPAAITDPEIKNIISQMAAAGVERPNTPEEWRRAYAFYAKFAGSPEHVFRVENRTIPGPSGPIPIRMYIPREGGNLPVWVFFHGGGFVAGSLDTHDVTLRAIANRCDCMIVSIAYRLAPESHFPAAPDDCYAATKWVADHAGEIGADPKRIAVGGDGAGGNLAAVVALMDRDRKGPHLVAQLLIYPTLDATTITPSRILSNDPVFTNSATLAANAAYIPVNTNPETPYISPVAEVNLLNLPPTYIFTGTNDPVVDEAQRYAMELTDAGVPVHISRYPNTIHGFFLMAGALESGKKCIDEVAANLKKSFGA